MVVVEARSMKPNCLSLQSCFQMQLLGFSCCGWLALGVGYSNVWGRADSPAGSSCSSERSSFTNCLGMALFLDFCRVQPVSNSTCRSMSAIIFLWILELFPRMVCNNLRELTVAEIRPDGTDIVALVHKCQKYASLWRLFVVSSKLPTLHRLRIHASFNNSVTIFSSSSLAMQSDGGSCSCRQCVCSALLLLLLSMTRQKQVMHTWEVSSLPWVVSKNSPNPYFIHPPMVNAACKSLLTKLNTWWWSRFPG